MSTPRHAAGDDTKDGRHYIHPVTGQRLISVTNAIGRHMEKPGLVPWAAKLATLEAWEQLPAMVKASRARDDCRDPKKPLYKQDLCGECWGCLTRWITSAHKRASEKASDLGSAVHRAAEAHLTGRPVIPDDDVEPFIGQYLTFLDDFGVDLERDVEAAELTVADPYRGYAGTLDIMLRLGVGYGDRRAFAVEGERRLWLIDIKTSLTRPATQTFPENQLQLVGLWLASEVWLPDDTVMRFIPKPTSIGVLNLRPTTYELVPFPQGDAVRNAFYGVLAAAMWGRDHWDTDRSHRPIRPSGRFKPKPGFLEDGSPKPGTRAAERAAAAAAVGVAS